MVLFSQWHYSSPCGMKLIDSWFCHVRAGNSMALNSITLVCLFFIGNNDYFLQYSIDALTFMLYFLCHNFY